MEVRNPKCKVIVEMCSIFRALQHFPDLHMSVHLILTTALGVILALPVAAEAQQIGVVCPGSPSSRVYVVPVENQRSLATGASGSQHPQLE